MTGCLTEACVVFVRGCRRPWVPALLLLGRASRTSRRGWQRSSSRPGRARTCTRHRMAGQRTWPWLTPTAMPASRPPPHHPIPIPTPTPSHRQATATATVRMGTPHTRRRRACSACHLGTPCRIHRGPRGRTAARHHASAACPLRLKATTTAPPRTRRTPTTTHTHTLRRMDTAAATHRRQERLARTLRPASCTAGACAHR